jgi:hypothetical protein
MTSLVLTERQGTGPRPDYRAHTQQLPGGLDVLVAPTGADSAMALDHELGMSSSDLVSVDCDLVADCGRLLPGSTGQARMIRAADRVLLVVRPDVAGIAHARWAIGRIAELTPSGATVVTMGSGTFGQAEMAEELGLAVLGVVPVDPRAALMACGVAGTARTFVRSDLVAFGRELLVTLIGETSPGRGRRPRTADNGRPGDNGPSDPDRPPEATAVSDDQRTRASAS